MSAPTKKSEVNELRTLLRTLEIQRDATKYREVVQKVIMYMTLGIDVSPLFSEMIMACATEDVVQKKLVYLYLCNYAESHSELTLLAVNTLQKSCRDPNPVVRGLALRSMCSLRVPNLVEYVLAPVQDGLRDKSPYVRKTAVMGVLKLFYTSESIVQECALADTLYGLLQDKDALVVANCVAALEEILATEGGIVLTKDITYTLFNRLRELPEWSQCIVMGVLSRYVPSNEDETFDILNILEDRLKHANSAVVLSATKLFLYFTRNMPDLCDSVLERLKTPLITLMTASTPEISLTLLLHIELLVARKPTLFASEFKAFFCRYNEPTYVKSKKLQILTLIAAPGNTEAVLEELGAYVTDVDVEMARKSIRAIGRIAARIPTILDHVISMMLAFQELDISYVTAETLCVLRDLLRRSPDRAARVLPSLQAVASSSVLEEEVEARAALIWILGEFGEQLDDAPYLLEGFVDGIADEISASVRVQLLTSTLRLFFARPLELQRTLGRLLRHCISEEQNNDVKDRALLYYRLLQAGVESAKAVVAAPAAPMTAEFLEYGTASKESLVDEFNTLSVIYGMPSSSFIIQAPPYNTVGTGRKVLIDQFSKQAPSFAAPAAPTAQAMPRPAPAAAAAAAAAAAVATASLLDLDLGSSAPPPRAPAFVLEALSDLRPADFEQIWVGSSIGATIKEPLKRVPSVPEIEGLLTKRGVCMMASSDPVNGVIRIFFHAKEKGGAAYHLVEANLDVGQGILSANFKSSQPVHVPDFAAIFRHTLHAAGLIEM